jgi:hypothetical protein
MKEFFLWERLFSFSWKSCKDNKKYGILERRKIAYWDANVRGVGSLWKIVIYLEK